MDNIVIRPAEVSDCGDIVRLVGELAKYEHMEDQLCCKPEDFKRLLFEDKIGGAFIAELDGETVGYALYFYNISTFKGKAGMFLEDLFVIPKARKKGIGKLLIQAVCKKAKDCKLGRFEWTCLDWNAPSRKFYEYMGAQWQKSWLIYRVDESGFDSFIEK